MRSGRNFFALITLLLLVLLSTACSQGDPEADKAAADAEEWAALEQAKNDLYAKRQELADMQARLDAEPAEGEADATTDGADGEAAEGDAEAAPTAEELAAQVDTLKDEVDDMSADFSNKLVQFINNQGITEGQEFTDIQRQAFNLKAQEDILIAMEFIDRGGEYQRAIDIISSSLTIDPTNELLLEAKANAEALRYMTQERFDQVKKGMTPDEVRELLGVPKSNNKREFENGITGWFYQKETPPNSAAGIFFQEKKGELVVYKTDFDAVKGTQEDGEGEEG